MNVFKYFKYVKKLKKIKKIIKNNLELENETKLLINNIKVNIELLANKIPEIKEVYLDILEEIQND